jgi:hypothetical protein
LILTIVTTTATATANNNINPGSVAPLKEVVELKKKHGFRLVLDECLSFGVSCYKRLRIKKISVTNSPLWDEVPRNNIS